MTRLNREARIDSVRQYMWDGETRIDKITRLVNKKHSTLCKRETIANDMVEVRRRNEVWMDQVADTDSSLKAEKFHRTLSQNFNLLETAIAQALQDVKQLYKAAQLYPQLLATIQAIWDLEERFPMYKSNAKLRARLKQREAELEDLINEEKPTIQAKDGR